MALISLDQTERLENLIDLHPKFRELLLEAEAWDPADRSDTGLFLAMLRAAWGAGIVAGATDPGLVDDLKLLGYKLP